MHDVMLPTRDPGWILTHDGYDVLTETAVESRFALGNGFMGMRASRPYSRGPTWVSWLGHIRWASWPRCYVAGLFDWLSLPKISSGVAQIQRWVTFASGCSIS